MRLLKLVILCVVITIVTAISWVMGTMTGNALTGTVPPPQPDAAKAGLAFLEVCAFNSILIAVMLDATRAFQGLRKKAALILYVFAIQFLLPQMETFFFASDIGLSYSQAAAILIAGAVVSLVTVLAAMLVHDKLMDGASGQLLTIPAPQQKKIVPWLASLVIIGYPALYLTFGYYVAWQNESLRVYYTSSAELASFRHQVSEAFSNGIYLFQTLRAFIWVVMTVPLVVLLKGNTFRQFAVVGVLTALLPTSLLFIPNPYMPYDIAMTHFVETSTSNFLWAVLMVWAIKKVFAV
jgi:hypothetical protein